MPEGVTTIGLDPSAVPAIIAAFGLGASGRLSSGPVRGGGFEAGKGDPRCVRRQRWTRPRHGSRRFRDADRSAHAHPRGGMPGMAGRQDGCRSCRQRGLGARVPGSASDDGPDRGPVVVIVAPWKRRTGSRRRAGRGRASGDRPSAGRGGQAGVSGSAPGTS